MASWFTRAIDKITPWDRGGEVRRRQERKKKEEEEDRQRNWSNRQSFGNAPNIGIGGIQPTQNIPNQQEQQPEPQKTRNIFEDLNQGLALGSPKTRLSVTRNKDTEPPEKLEPGAVVRPKSRIKKADSRRHLNLPDDSRSRRTKSSPEEKARQTLEDELDRGKSWEDIARDNNFDLAAVREYSKATRPDYGMKIRKPDQSIGDRFRDIFDANTEADQYRRYRGNIEKGENKDITLRNPGNIVSRTPLVGTVTKMANTGVNQLRQLPATVEGAVATKMQSDLTEEMLDAQERGDQEAYDEARQKLDWLAPKIRRAMSQQEDDAERFEKNSGGLLNTGTLYDEEAAKRGDPKTGVTDIALPTAVAGLDLYTLGKGSIVARAVKSKGLSGAASTQKGNIGKLAAGNYASGDIDARSKGASNEDAIKSGLLTALLGTGPDIALPAIARSLRARRMPQGGRSRPPGQSRPIEVAQDIPIEQARDVPQPVRVRNATEPKPVIREVAGDTNVVTPDSSIQKAVNNAREESAAAANNAARPDQRAIDRFEGVGLRQPEAPYVPDSKVIASNQDRIIDEYATFLRDVGEGNGVAIAPDGRRISNNVRTGDTKGKRMTKAAWREEAERQLRAGSADSSIQQAFNDVADPEIQSMLAKGEQPPVPEGRPIEVKQARSIPVRDETVVPTDLPEAPGRVRVTAQTAPNNAKSEAIALEEVPTTPPRSKAMQAMDEEVAGTSRLNKRQVASARNQRKLARQMAKTQEDTAAAMERIDASNPRRVADQPEGYAPTGKFKKGKRGNVSESASRATETQAGVKEMASRSVDDLLDEISVKETLTPGDRRRISAAKENLMRTDPDGFRSTDRYRLLDNLEKSSRSDLGRGLALIPRTIRKTANSDALTSRWERRVGNVLDDPSKMTDIQWKQVQGANDAFTTARNRASELEERFKKTGSEADYNAWEQAHKIARDADTSAKMVEVKTAQQILKDEKGANVTKTIDALKKEADVNTMDFITANMLSGTGTGFRNTFGTELAGIENRLFANTRGRVTNKLFGENVGGYDRKGARFGRKLGGTKWVGDIKKRAKSGGKNPMEWAKNWSTAINSGGESSMQAQVYSRLAKYYKNQFDAQGLSGKNLDLRMRHAMVTDPDNMADTYLDSVMKSSGLTGVFEKGQTIEKSVVDYVGRHVDSKLAQGASKLLMRLAVGFPTATGNFMYQSAKRLTVGLPSYIETGMKLARGDKAAAALAFERGLKEAGSGTAMLGFGVALGSAGMISGAYPDDKNERERWEREGISENSIKIGGAWYPIPQGAGMLGLPIMTGAAIGRDGPGGIKEMYSPKNLAKLLPTDQVTNSLNMVAGDASSATVKNTLASSVRATTPVGALFNQIARSFDSTKNDTTTKSLWNNVLDQVASGVPGVNNAMNIPDKTDAEGNVIKNPNPAELAFGSFSAAQSGGEERSVEINEKINSSLGQINKYGLLNNPNLEGVLDGTAQEALVKANAGKQLDESDIKSLKEGLVKGVSQEGTDTAYLEREQYDTNLGVLKLKRDLMSEDPTVKPSSLENIDTAIKRGEVYRDNEIPYSMISDYQDTSLTEWRKMGDPDDDEYNLEMYERLWQMDQLMTENKVSDNYKGDMEKNKYYAKSSGSGGGRGRGGRGGRGRSLGGDFGKLKAGSFAPQVRAYETIDQRSGSIPRIRVERPNIVHKITTSR